NLFAADPSKAQRKRAAERAGASLRARRPSHRATVRSYSAIRTDLYARQETSFAFLALHAKSAPDSGLVDRLHLLRREHTNPLQFLVGEVRLFLVSGALYVAQSRFLRNAPEFRFRYVEKEGSSCLRHIFRDLIVHDLPQCRHDGHAVFFDSRHHRLVNVGVACSPHFYEPSLLLCGSARLRVKAVRYGGLSRWGPCPRGRPAPRVNT